MHAGWCILENPTSVVPNVQKSVTAIRNLKGKTHDGTNLRSSSDNKNINKVDEKWKFWMPSQEMRFLLGEDFLANLWSYFSKLFLLFYKIFLNFPEFVLKFLQHLVDNCGIFWSLLELWPCLSLRQLESQDPFQSPNAILLKFIVKLNFM